MPYTHQHSAHHNLARLSIFVIGAVVTLLMSTTLTGARKLPAPKNNVVACIPQPLDESLARADIILTGSVFLVVPDGDKYANVLITPERVFKGSVPTSGIRIRALATAAGTHATADDLHFASQQPPYLLFLQAQQDGRYLTSKCLGSRLLGDGLTPSEQLVLEPATNVP